MSHSALVYSTTTVQQNKKRGLYSFTEGTTKHLYEHKHNPRMDTWAFIVPIACSCSIIGRFTVNAIALNAINVCFYCETYMTKVGKLFDNNSHLFIFCILRIIELNRMFLLYNPCQCVN